MPSQRFEASLAASTPLTNLMSGSKFEMLPFPAAVQIFGVQDGADPGSLVLDFTMGNVIEGDNLAVPTFTANLGPNLSDHRICAGVSARHDRLQVRLMNNDAVNASNYRFMVIITPL